MTVTPALLAKVWTELSHHLDICRDANEDDTVIPSLYKLKFIIQKRV
jgi:hypothetical protein